MIVRYLATLAILVTFGTIQSNAQAQCHAGDIIIPIGGTTSVQFYDSSFAGSGQITSYLWTFGDGSYSTQMDTVHVYAAMGTYQVCHKIQTSTGCIDSTCQIITVGNGCTLSGGIAFDSIANILIANASGGSAPYTYLWSTGQITNTIAPNAPGVYCVTISDANGCVQHDSVTINLSTALHENNFETVAIYYSQELSMLKVISRNNSQI